MKHIKQKTIPSGCPLLTVALPVYNGGATLAMAIQSIVMQSFTDWELIILNDASTDDSLDVIRSFDDSRIRLVDGEENIGLAARLNMAVDMAVGCFFARMDQDDVSFPDRFEKQLHYLTRHSEVDLLGASAVYFRGDGIAIGRLPVLTQHADICAKPWNGFHLPHPSWMGKTSWFRECRYHSFANGAEDQHLLLRRYQESKFACLNDPLLAYREGERLLNKMLRARRIFAFSYLRYFLRERCYTMALKVTVLFCMKSFADFLNVMFNVSSMRNSLLPLSSSELKEWNLLWHSLEKRLND